MLISSSAFAAEKISLLDTSLGKKLDTRGWLGLWRHRLEPVKVTLRRVPATEDTGEMFEADFGTGAARPLFVVKGLKAGPVKTVHAQHDGFPDVGAKVRGEGFELEVQKHGPAGRKLVLREGATEQVLYQQAEADLDGWGVSWVGDADGDGKLDFLIEADRHYNLSTSRLFLSSKAGKGQLVKQVAVSTATGC